MGVHILSRCKEKVTLIHCFLRKRLELEKRNSNTIPYFLLP